MRLIKFRDFFFFTSLLSNASHFFSLLMRLLKMEDTFVMFWKVNSKIKAQFVLVSILLAWVSGQWKTLMFLISQSYSASIPYQFSIQLFFFFMWMTLQIHTIVSYNVSIDWKTLLWCWSVYWVVTLFISSSQIITLMLN